MKEIMTKVQAANIDSLGYYRWQKIVFIQFINGTKYQYYDVPEDVYNELLKAVSIGSYLHRMFKGVYRYARVAAFEKHLCYICKYDVPTCNGKEIKYGDGIGKDNILECDCYVHAESKKKELLPCPFCDGKADIRQGKDFNTFYVECSQCATGTCDMDKIEAINAWNRRTP